MQKFGKLAFVLAPICLFASFFSSAVLQSDTLMSVFIVIATFFLIVTFVTKLISARREHHEEDPHD